MQKHFQIHHQDPQTDLRNANTMQACTLLTQSSVMRRQCAIMCNTKRNKVRLQQDGVNEQTFEMHKQALTRWPQLLQSVVRDAIPPGSLASVLRRCMLSLAMSSACLFAITTADAFLPARGFARSSIFLRDVVRNVIPAEARCPAALLWACPTVCCRSLCPPRASSPSQWPTRFSRPGVSPDRQYCCGMLSAMLLQLRHNVQTPCYGPARMCAAVHPPGPLLCMSVLPISATYAAIFFFQSTICLLKTEFL